MLFPRHGPFHYGKALLNTNSIPCCRGNLADGGTPSWGRGVGGVVCRRRLSPPSCVPLFFCGFLGRLGLPSRHTPALNTGPRDDSPRPRA